MNDIQVDRFNRFLRKFLAMDQNAPAPTVAPELLPVLNVNAGDRPEEEYLRDVKLWTVTGVIGAVAAQYAYHILVNTSLNRVATVESVRGNSAAVLSNRPTVVGGWAVYSQGHARDARYTNDQGCLLLYVGNTAAAPFPFDDYIEWAANWTNAVGWVIPPGRALLVHAQLVNVALSASYSYRDRVLERGELTA